MAIHVPLLLQDTLFPKPKRGKQHLLQISLIEQLPIMSFDRVQDLRGLQNLTYIFTLFLRSSLRKTICQWTNHEGAIVYGCLWKLVNDKEFKVFLGVVILIGVCRSNNESVTQLGSTLHGPPIFNCIMRRGRYQQILRFLRFDNTHLSRHHRSSDKLQPIRKVFEIWDSYLRDSYIYRSSMTVDEQLVCYRGRCPFKQYIPSKPGKCEIKI